jgi:hypothetical protein
LPQVTSVPVERAHGNWRLELRSLAVCLFAHSTVVCSDSEGSRSFFLERRFFLLIH